MLKTVGFDQEGVPVAALREIALLKSFAHPNVVELRGAWCGYTYYGCAKAVLWL